MCIRDRAMAVGCPVVCCDFASLRESIGQAGIVCKPGDLDSMAHWCQSFLDDGVREEWSKKSRLWASKFDSRKCTRNIVEAVNSVVEN